ncbi:MAG: thioredoxin domain-containing protein [Desulfobacteraceae bacterium]|nr:thioredoxin domain-containing protein [Desulfobacteraceae bacterium]
MHITLSPKKLICFFTLAGTAAFMIVLITPIIANMLIKKTIQENPNIVLDIIKKDAQKTFEESIVKKRIEELKNPKHPSILDGRTIKPGSNPDAPVTIVVYSSFQCPKCSEGSKIIENLMAIYPGQLKVYYKHLTGDTLAFQQGLLFEAVAVSALI